MSDLLKHKNEQFAHSLIFGEWPEQFAHGHSFLVRDVSESLMVAYFWWATWVIGSHHSLKKRKWVNHSFFSKNLQKCTKKHFIQIFLSESLVFCEQKSKWAICSEKRSNLLICSFIMSDLSKLLTVAHLSWRTWAIHSRLLFWHERPEWIPSPDCKHQVCIENCSNFSQHEPDYFLK